MPLIGLILAVIGLLIMLFARRTEGFSGAVLFLLGLLLFLIGLYFLFFERGSGAARWLGGVAR